MKTKLATQAGRLDTAVIFENKLGAQSYLAYIKALTHSLTRTQTIRRSQKGKSTMEAVQKLDREGDTGKIVVLKKIEYQTTEDRPEAQSLVRFLFFPTMSSIYILYF